MRRLFVNAILTGVVPEGVLLKCGHEMDSVESLSDAWLLVEDGIIAGFGTMCGVHSEGGIASGFGTMGVGRPVSCPEADGTASACEGKQSSGNAGRAGDCAALPAADEIIDCRGAMLLPAFCDSHTHIVYAGSREGEFLDKIGGLSYEQIASRGGGILNSAQRLHDTPEDELFSQAMERVAEMMRQGTGSIEIKSGYGLNPQDELKMLRVIDRIKRSAPALVRSTFLGAHAVGRGYSHSEYVSAVCDMMPEAASLADFVDIFCERGFFTTDDAERILALGERHGLRGKIHANQLSCSGGVQVGVKCGALSVDHLEQTGPEEIAALLASLESWRACGGDRNVLSPRVSDRNYWRSATGDSSSAAGADPLFGAAASRSGGAFGRQNGAAAGSTAGLQDGAAADSTAGLQDGAAAGTACDSAIGPTIATMLPGSSFFLGLPYGRGREFIDSGLPVALASDFNPGSAPSGDMRFVMALGCIKMKLTPVRAFNAATINGAYAMGVSRLAGSITPGKRADLILTLPGWNLTRIAYLHHTPFVRSIYIRGERIL